MAWDQRPDRRTRRAFLHLSYSYATAVWTGVTRDTRPISDAKCAPQQSNTFRICASGGGGFRVPQSMRTGRRCSTRVAGRPKSYGERGIVTTSCHSPQSQAWRRNVSGIAKGPLPFFWGSTRPFETPRGRRYSPASSGGIGPNRGADSNCLVRSWPGCVKTLTLFWKVEFASQFRSHRTQQRSQHLT